jgi:hypothetical protein
VEERPDFPDEKKADLPTPATAPRPTQPAPLDARPKAADTVPR